MKISVSGVAYWNSEACPYANSVQRYGSNGVGCMLGLRSAHMQTQSNAMGRMARVEFCGLSEGHASMRTQLKVCQMTSYCQNSRQYTALHRLLQIHKPIPGNNYLRKLRLTCNRRGLPEQSQTGHYYTPHPR